MYFPKAWFVWWGVKRFANSHVTNYVTHFITSNMNTTKLRSFRILNMFKLLKTPLLSYGKQSVIKSRSFATANCYPGSLSQFTNKMTFESTTKIFPTYRVMDEQGNIIKKEDDPKVILDCQYQTQTIT